MRRCSILVCLPLLSATLTGCPVTGSGKPTMNFKSSTESLQLGSGTVITLTATGTDDGQPWVDGSTAPVFSTTWGSFESQQENPGGADVQTDPNGTITGHSCSVTLYPDPTPPKGGSFVATAVYTDTAGNQVTANITIAVTVASVESLTFDCETYNIGALFDLNSQMEIRCNAQAFDINHNQVPGANIQFLAEAGSISFDSLANTYAYFPFVPGPGNVGSHPQDVQPRSDLNEPSYVDTADPTQPTRNPRDGLTTLVAYVTAATDGVMANGLSNAAYMGAPFVDVDDTGTWHAGDPFLDINNNGTYAATQPNNNILWKQIKILWTGSVQSSPPVAMATWNGQAPLNVDLPYGQSGVFQATILDQNLNIVAANNPEMDDIIWDSNMLPNAEPQAPGQTLLVANNGPRLGFNVDSNFNIIAGTAWEIGGTASTNVMNQSACSSATAPVTFTVYGMINRTQWIDQNGNPQDEISSESTISVNGMADQPPPSVCGP